MKKIAIFMFLCFCTAFLSAQTTYTSAVQTIKLSGINNFDSPICKWDDNRSIMYLKENASSMYFCVIDHSAFNNPIPSTTPVPAPTITGRCTQISLPMYHTDLTVNDIYYVDGYAFFCGTIKNRNNEWTAVVGYFNPNEIISLSATTIKYSILKNSPDNAPTTLYRLVAYSHGGDYSVVAYGDDLSEPPGDHDFSTTKIVELNQIVNSTPSTCNMADMAYGVIFNPDIPGYQITKKQYLDDIFLTDSYVVLTGHDWNYPQTTNPSIVNMHAAYHFGAKGSVLADLFSPNHNCHLDGFWETNDTVVGVALDGDIFTISYVYPENNQNFYTRVRVIDPNVPYNTYAVQYLLPQKYNPVRMVYHDMLNSVEIMQPIYNRSDFTMVDLATLSTFVAPVLSPTPDRYRSMHGMYGDCFISSNMNQIYMQNRSTSLPPSIIGCPKLDYVDVFHIDLINIDTVARPAPKTCRIINSGSISPNLILDIYDNCFSFE